MSTTPVKNTFDHLGYYQVGKKKFYNKTLALIESYRTRHAPSWVFNDDVYASIDWTIPIEENLASIYRRRAQQLRDRYDHLVLYYSGGADSTNILHAFIDNKIFLDEIVMQLPELVKPKLNTTDLTNGNIHSEIEYAAAPHLNQYSSQLAGTVIRYQDFSKNVIELLQKDNWFDSVPMSTNITVSGIGRQLASVADAKVLKLCEQGRSVAQIIGIDKPLVTFDGNDYYAYFMDLNATHSPSVDITFAGKPSDLLGVSYTTEFFYWTPDMPEIVVKQAQEIKRECELDSVKKQLWTQSQGRHITEFRSVMHPIIYPAWTEPVFQTDKPSSQVRRRQDQWFWDTASDQVIGHYLDGIDYLKKNIDTHQLIDRNIMNGLRGHSSPRYKL